MIKRFGKYEPKIDETAFIAETADIIGNIEIGKCSSVWYGAAIRSEGVPVKIGEYSNIQDNCTIHVSPGLPVNVGSFVSVGHGTILHSATVGDNCLIGMGAILLNGCVIGKNSFVAAGSIVGERMEFPEGSLVAGSPAKVIGSVPDKLRAVIKDAYESYANIAAAYKREMEEEK